MAEIETIPIPTRLAKRKDPIHLRVNHLDAWPQQQFLIRLDWNHLAGDTGRWMWEMQRVGDDEPLFRRAPARLAPAYTHKNILMAQFIDPAGTEDRVSPNNLGDEVKLAVFPGPGSPGFEPEPDPPTQRY